MTRAPVGCTLRRVREADEILTPWLLSEDPRAVQAAAAAIERLSCGQVRNSETINRRTGKPERDGLHCARIFGPTEDLRCLCGKFAGAASAGQVCDRCGVLCGERRLRDERWGHVESPVPLLHPALARRVAAMLGCEVRGLQRVIRQEANLGADGRVVAYDDAVRARGAFHVAAQLGAEAATWMPTRVPVAPPTWRATRRDPLDGAYAGLIHRCNRLRRLMELNAPEIITDNEARMVQESLDRLLAAARAELRARGPVVRAPATARAATLLEAVYDEPLSDAPRLAYAEFLREHGDLRGEFIALQLDRADRSQMSRRERDMLRRNYAAWIGTLAEAVDPGVVFRRGFPAACRTIAAGARARLGDPAWATIEHLETDIAALVMAPELRALESLTAPLRAVREVCEGGAVLPRVHSLQLRMQRFSPEQVEAVTRGEALPGLRTLTIVDASNRGAELGWLDGTPLARGLERLTLELPLESLDSLSLRGWLQFRARHPGIVRMRLVFGRQLLRGERRVGGAVPALQVATSRGLIERIALGAGEIAESLERILTAIEPYELPLVQIESPGSWFGEELERLAQRLRAHFGPSLTLPRPWA